jgi:hypothetical protein
MIAGDRPMPVSDDEQATAPAPHPLHALVEDWFARHFHNSIVARDTATFNHVFAAKEDLKRLLAPARDAAEEREISDG